MFRQSVMVFHIPGWLFAPEKRTQLEGILGDIALCALLGVQPILILSLEHPVMSRIRSESGEEVEMTSGPSAATAEALCKAAARISGEEDALRLFKQEAGLVCEEVERLLSRLASTDKDGKNSDGKQHFSVYASSQLFSSAPRASSGAEPSKLLGRVQGIDAAQIQRRLAAREVVCLMPLAAGVGSVARYVPSEELATEVAKAVKASKLIFFTRGQRFVDAQRNSVLGTLQEHDAKSLIKHAQEHPALMTSDHATEMFCYLELLVHALKGGTRRGHLIDPQKGALLQELYTTDGSGTMVSCDLYDGLRLANSGDVPGILELIEPLAAKGLLRRRSAYEVERACNNNEFFVWKKDDETIGCSSLQRFEDAPAHAELGCFVVSPKCRGKGHGVVLLSYVEQVALLQGVTSLFLLTTQTMQWFVEKGFKDASLDVLPPSKRAGYDPSRSSKVFLKNLTALSSTVQKRFTFVEVDTLD
eukprot:TRINITY_DN94727_c0_g1_i1.p1 TRINITY_DN94727_c0_g1~~TRINITY_DN94727_c0_g1_i1.p1  ORF type:complete len:474 (+),score=98.64 TRINITY_DN94727_c0_g1_i1:627-2048(+)